ncbi:prolyl oligopeptidase family serine peptidase [Massilia oculi]|uniref:Prolyl oligopeptidase family serine peptidase n=1 Tax=Massilia hydrophila TaxID=3044279 RepID=A0ABS7YEM0_9BURK|nr:prolyl oligopeptidase family serine peptidase [Massilia oculi]MCA1856805.1 prolyl oligopeptidase family serine peptidase [Massilia oculi]
MHKLPHLYARLLCVLALGAPFAAPLHAEPAPPPATAFFSRALLADAELSPSGRYLAALSGAAGGRDKLMVVDLQENKAQLVAGYDNIDIHQFEWVNDNRLLFNVRDKGASMGGGNSRAGLFAVNRDGTGLRQLASRRAKGAEETRDMLPHHTYLLRQRGAQDSDEVYVVNLDYTYADRQQNAELLRLNTVTGKTRSVPRPGRVDSWLLDHAGEPRLATYSSGTRTSIHYLDPASGKWRALAEYDTQAGDRNAILPLGFGPDGKLYVRSNAGKDTTALYTLDLATGKLGANPVLVLPGYDFSGKLVEGGGKLLGVSVETDAPAQAWFDKDMAALQQTIDALLSGGANLLSVAARPDAPWVLVQSFSDLQPPVYRLYNRATGKLKPVGNSRDGIDPAAMGRQEPLRYTARDGREIPAMLTLPAGGAKKNLPLVLLVHDWPYSRGNHWGWSAEQQFLATRGYAVLEPDYRGSTGYGQAHFQAGWNQWGLAMQDDLADAARWAIAQGIADPKRICIAGAGYGGYATLIGLAQDPGLYKCGIAWNAVTNPGLLSGRNGDFFRETLEDSKAYAIRDLVGDPGKLAAPLAQAARITQPVLLAHGNDDRYVPFYDSTRFRDALRLTNPSVEWAEYPGEDHAWQQDKTRVDFWSKVDAFLARQIGPGTVQK